MSTLNSPWYTGDNYGPGISIITWFLLVISVLAVIARLSTKLAVFKKLRVDDWVISAAVIFCIAQSIIISVEATNGLGQHLNKLTSIQRLRVQQTQYAANILYVATLGLVKISILQFIRVITPVATHREVIVSLGIFLSLWTVTSMFVIAFQCHLPFTWEMIENSCIDQATFWNYFEIISVLTDLALVILPCHVVGKIQLPITRKLLIASCFACRVLVIVASICELFYSNELSTTDLTFSTWPVAVCRQIILNTSLTTACLPYLKSFLLLLKSGIPFNGPVPPEEQNSTYWYLSDKLYTPRSSRTIAPLSSKSSWKTTEEFWEYAYRVEGIRTPRSLRSTDSYAKMVEDKKADFCWDHKMMPNRPFKQSRVWTLDPEAQRCERWLNRH